MNREQMDALIDLAGGKLQCGCSMASYTTFRVGGCVDALLKVQEAGDLLNVIPFLQKEGIPWFVVGRGSNLLIMDADVPGVAIRLEGTLAAIGGQMSRSGVIIAGAGASLRQLLELCRRKGYGGAEFLAGIPGTVGGAAVMNAGAFGKDMTSLVCKMEMVTPGGELVERDGEKLSFGYRKLELEEGAVVTRVHLKLEKSTPTEVVERIKSYLSRRKEKQPFEYPSAGSIFKNPPGDYAGRLIELAGLKGKRRGDAMVSTKHANWIVNTGEASSRDILGLITLVRETVSKKLGINLELEIRVIGR
jgi:UDP-N-acetylmuramate dehydrogenase